MGWKPMSARPRFWCIYVNPSTAFTFWFCEANYSIAMEFSTMVICKRYFVANLKTAVKWAVFKGFFFYLFNGSYWHFLSPNVAT